MAKLEALADQVGRHETKIQQLEAKIVHQDDQIAKMTSSSAANTNNKGVEPLPIISNGKDVGKLFMPRTCHEARNTDPTLVSGLHWIDPDGTNVGDSPIQVYCDMTSGTIPIQ